MKLLCINKIIFFVITLFLSQFAFATDKLVLIDSQDSYHLTWPKIFEDKTNKLTIQDITSHTNPISYKRSNFKNPNYGYKLYTYWTTFSLENQSNKQKDWILEIDYTLLDYIDLYIQQADGSFAVKHAGRTFPFKKNEINGRNFGFKLKLEVGEKQTYYLKIKTQDTSAFPIIIRTPDDYITAKSKTLFFFGLYYGILLVMIVYNGFIYLSLKDISYAYYVLYCFGYGLFQILFNGLAFEYIWPSWPSFNIAIFPFSIGLAHIGGIKFVQSFLHTKDYDKKINIALNILFGIAVIGCVLSFLAPYIFTISLVTILSLLFGITAILASISSWKYGYSPARFFIMAWSLLLFGIITLSLKCAGFVPVNFITIYGIQIGSVLDLSLLAFALADRINLMSAQKAEKEKELTSIRKELELAKKIQESILPRSLPEINGLAVYAKYLPMEEIGGDYYDFLESKDGNLIIIIADVSGHGLPAAMVASMAKVAFIMDARISNSPAHILTSMNTNLHDQFKGKYLTAMAISIDVTKNSLTLSNAGHLPLLIVRKYALPDPLSVNGERREFTGSCEIIELTTDGGFPIGWMKENDIEEISINIQSGDRIILYTDCILESKNQANIEYGKENYSKFIINNYHLKPHEFTNMLINELREWSGTQILADDFTIVIIDYKL